MSQCNYHHLSMEQLHFLQNLLGGIENENQMDGYAYWWIGLNDVETEGEFVWPVYGPANFTWWVLLLLHIVFYTNP